MQLLVHNLLFFWKNPCRNVGVFLCLIFFIDLLFVYLLKIIKL